MTAHKPPQAAPDPADRFAHAILDSMAQHVAVLDHAGVILAVNQAWQNFARSNAVAPDIPVRHADVGADYLAACAGSETAADNSAQEAASGIRAVLERHLPQFTLEYPCHSPAQQRWFAMMVTPIEHGAAAAVVTHTDITPRKLAELAANDALVEMQALNRRLEQAHSQLLQSEKMAAIGQLAAGVAHELNNPIGFIQSNIGSLQSYVENLLEVLAHAEVCAGSCADGTRSEQFQRLRQDKDIEIGRAHV